MITAGIDVGSRTTKAVIMEDGELLGQYIGETGWKPVDAGTKAYSAALEKAKINSDNVKRIVATGYGRVSLPFANETITEITCHARGAHFINPSIRTIIDIGGQDSKVIRIEQHGLVEDFAMNDRCAAGTGKFIEFLAHTLNMNVSDFSRKALESQSPVTVSSMCTVFSESEVLSLVAENVPIPDIVAGLHLAIARRITALIDTIGYDETVALTGGGARNQAIRIQLEELLKVRIYVPDKPEFIGALGAAISAQRPT